MRALLGDLSARLTSLHADTAALLDARRDEALEQARLGALAGARLAADGIRLIGPPSARLRTRRVQSGAAVDLPFGSQMGLTCRGQHRARRARAVGAACWRARRSAWTTGSAAPPAPPSRSVTRRSRSAASTPST